MYEIILQYYVFLWVLKIGLGILSGAFCYRVLSTIFGFDKKTLQN